MYQVPNVSRHLWSAATVKNKNIEKAWLSFTIIYYTSPQSNDLHKLSYLSGIVKC
jgi:hypothetical protein